MALTNEQQWLLQALKCFLHPETEMIISEINTSASLESIWRLSYIHTVLPLIYDVVAQAPAGDEAQETLRAYWKQQTLQAVFAQTIRSHAFLELCKAFREAGVKVLVVKGILCRSLYPKADYRTSSDEDCFVSPEDFASVHNILLQHGLKVTDSAGSEIETAQVVTYADKASGLRIELHRQLFSQDSAAYGKLNEVFAHAMELAVEVPVEGVPVWSMCPTDHMLYLLFHAYKHFLHSGFGIRQVCDICVYAERFDAEIEWMQVQKTLASFQTEVFAAALWKIGQEYLGFEKSSYLSAEVPPVEDLLLDILAGGIYGASSEDRQHSSLITLNAVTGQGRNASVLRTAFPNANALKGKYMYLNTKPWLLPIAWTQRLFGYLKKGGETSAYESVRIGNERVALMKKYRILR